MEEKFRHARREREIAELAGRQYGVLGRRQLLRMGISQRTLERWVARRRLHPIHRDAYAYGHKLIPKRGRWLAAVLGCGEEALLSHASAAALWGIAGSRPWTDVTASRGRQGVPRRLGIRLHRGKIAAADCDERDRIPVTSVARTLFDLAEVIPFHQLEQAWEEADRLRLLQLSVVEEVCERGYGRRALKPTRRLLAEARAPAQGRSPLEERFHRFREIFNIPAGATNVEVLGKEVDVLWPDARLIAELDSWEFHGHRAAFQRDRARDTRLLVAGYRTVRVTHDRLDTEASTLAAEIRELLRARVVLPEL